MKLCNLLSIAVLGVVVNNVNALLFPYNKTVGVTGALSGFGLTSITVVDSYAADNQSLKDPHLTIGSNFLSLSYKYLPVVTWYNSNDQPFIWTKNFYNKVLPGSNYPIPQAKYTAQASNINGYVAIAANFSFAGNGEIYNCNNVVFTQAFLDIGINPIIVFSNNNGGKPGENNYFYAQTGSNYITDYTEHGQGASEECTNQRTGDKAYFIITGAYTTGFQITPDRNYN
jgi:hypothetical protein